MIAGLTAGAIAAIVAALVSLPLRSPLDNVFNSATVAAAALIVGILSGLLWNRLGPGPNRTRNYGAALALALVAVIVAAVVVNIWLERMIVFTVPLAVIIFILSGLLTLALARLSGAAANLTAAACLIAAVAVGGGLVTQGDAESGDLALPERMESPAPPATRAPTEVVQPATATTPPTDAPANTPAATGPADSAPAKGETPTRPATSRPAATPTSQPVPDEPESGARYVVGRGLRNHLHRGGRAQERAFAIRRGDTHHRTLRRNQRRRPAVKYQRRPAHTGQRPSNSETAISAAACSPTIR